MVALCLVIFIDFVGFGLVLPLSAAFQKIYNLDPLQVGLFTAFFSLAGLVGSLLLGPLSDKFGRKSVLLVSSLFLAFGYFMNAYVQLFHATFNDLLWWRIVVGFFSGNIPVAFAAAADLSINNLQNRRKYMAILGSAIGLGFMLGPTLGGLIGQVTHQQTIDPFYFASVLTLILCVLLIFFFKETLPKIVSKKQGLPLDETTKQAKPLLQQLKTILNSKKVLLTSLLYFSFFFTFAGFEVYLITFTLSEQLHLTQLGLGLMWTMFAITNTVLQVFLVRIFKMRTALVLGFFCYALAIFLYIFSSSSLFLVALNMIFAAFSVALVMPNLSTAISLEGNIHQQGSIFGINQSLGNLGRGLGPFILGGIFDAFHTINAVWLTMSLLIFVLIYVVIIVIPKDAISHRK